MGRLSLDIHPEAVAESRAAWRWYQSRMPWQPTLFSRNSMSGLRGFGRPPNSIRHICTELRCYLLRRFPYLLVYRVTSESVHVYAVCTADGDRATGRDDPRPHDGRPPAAIVPVHFPSKPAGVRTGKGQKVAIAGRARGQTEPAGRQTGELYGRHVRFVLGRFSPVQHDAARRRPAH